jgi:hypothetical protein
LFCFFSSTAQAEHLPIGMEILANCHNFFSKGKIKRLHKEKYVINFDKDARPVLCTPFAWDSMFLVPYKPVSEYTNPNGKVFKKGDHLKIEFKATPRGAFFSRKFTITTAIKEINENGAAQLEIKEGDIKAQQLFTRWVGTNFVLLDLSDDLTADKLTILNIEKQ